jgi:CBS domain-containing protein
MEEATMHAKDIMSTEVVCIDASNSVFDAAEVLLGARVSAAPVINDKGAIIGILSEADLVRRAEIGTAASKGWLGRLLESEASSARAFVTAQTRRVADVMTKDVITANEDATLAELVDLMEDHGIKRIPIVRGDVVVGMVSRADLLGALLSRESDSPVLQPTDEALRQNVVDALEDRPWTSRWPVNVYANNGIVHLWGFVEGKDVRDAYCVAAENVPGVRRVKNHLRTMPASVGMGV